MGAAPTPMSLPSLPPSLVEFGHSILPTVHPSLFRPGNAPADRDTVYLRSKSHVQWNVPTETRTLIALQQKRHSYFDLPTIN